MTKNDYLKLIDKVIAAGPYDDTWESLCRWEAPEWYKDAKLGIFIHWGVYAVPAYGSEWYSRYMYVKGSKEYEHHQKTYGTQDKFGYKDFIPMFKGEKFDAAEWVKLFKEAGAKYIMPVSEHHDGFQMYESELSEWNAGKMGPCRDVISELKKACEDEGMTLTLSNHRAEHCWFFNGGLDYECDVNDPLYESFYDKQQAKIDIDIMDIYAFPPPASHCEDWLARLCEIVEKYRPAIMYFDWWIHNTGFAPYLRKFAAYYYNRMAQSGLTGIINYKFRAFAPGSAVFDVERGQLNGINPRIWQTCTAAARNSWGYTENNDFKDPAELIRDLIDIVSKNGRMLLNVGPRADGSITDEDRDILAKIGAWLKINGEGINGTSFFEVFGEGSTNIGGGSMTDGKPLEYTENDIRFTQRGGFVYAFLMKYPPNGKIAIKYFKKHTPQYHSGGDLDIKEVTVLGYDVPLTFSRDDDAMNIQIGGAVKSDYPVCLKIKIYP
ncbi:MAG: alpha-L-fucosidase [Lachnospiraceae bacterium]|nr:alpha-L-fucosidase [Lachnospiraceae bacterium]